MGPTPTGAVGEQDSGGNQLAVSLPPTFLLFPPLEFQHHIIMTYEGMDWRVQVKDIPQEQAVLPPQLGNHHGHQSIAERLWQKREKQALFQGESAES